MSEAQTHRASVIIDQGPKQRQIAILALLAVTLVWGATFVWMKQALDALDDEKATLGTNGVVAVLVFARFAIAALLMTVFPPNFLQQYITSSGFFLLSSSPLII